MKMKYYINERGFLTEISKERFYALRLRKSAHETIMLNGGRKVGRYLKFY